METFFRARFQAHLIIDTLLIGRGADQFLAQAGPAISEVWSRKVQILAGFEKMDHLIACVDSVKK